MPKLDNREHEIDAEIGDRIRARRTRLGLSQAELASLIGMSFQQVQKYERGSNRIASSTLIRVAEALKCPASYFLSGGRDLNSNQKWLAELVADKQTAAVLRQFAKLSSIKLQHKALSAFKAAIKDAEVEEAGRKNATQPRVQAQKRVAARRSGTKAPPLKAVTAKLSKTRKPPANR